jgi:glycolate oxidase FAD binding subunit
LHIDGVGPIPVTRPASVPEVGDLVRQAATRSEAVFPLGGRTMLGIGNPPGRAGVGIDLTSLSGVIDYPARDMTITVQAGITLARLHDILRGEGQRLPVDVPLPDRATLGGAVATNTSGPRRLGLGTFRDYIIGISTVNDEGQETRAGGRVVKNVAGYDLCKLHVGALGTLGIVTQVTLKLKPLPEETALIVGRCQGSDLEEVLDGLHATRTRPVCVEVLNPVAASTLPGVRAKGEAWAVVVGFEENAEAVRWQVQKLVKELASGKTQEVEALANSAADPLWSFLTEFKRSDSASLSFKANLPPHATANFCQLANSLDETLSLQAHAASGIVLGHLGGPLTAEKAAPLLQRLRDTAVAAQGNVVLTRCPAGWKSTLPVWGAPRGDAALMATVRDQFDPRRLFNPGRFLA